MMKIKAREAFSLTERLKARMNLNLEVSYEFIYQQDSE